MNTLPRSLFVLIIIIVALLTAAFDAAAGETTTFTVDITRLLFLDAVNYDAMPEAASADILRFEGSLSAGRSFNISSIIVPRQAQVVVNITADLGAAVNVRNVTFPFGLHMFLRPKYVNSNCAVNLDAVHVKCTSPSPLKCPNSTAMDSSDRFTKNNGVYAFFLEVPPLTVATLKSSAATIAVTARDSSFTMQDDGSAPLASSLLAFAVHHQQYHRIASATDAVGFGYPPSATVHGTRMPFVSLDVRDTQFTCEADRGADALGEGHSPDFVGCVSLGTGNRTGYGYGRELQRKYKARRHTDYRGVTWAVAMVFSQIDLVNISVSAKTTGVNAAGVVLGEALFKRMRLVQSTVSFSECAQDCAAVAVQSSYGDNYTSKRSSGGSSGGTAPTTTTTTETSLSATTSSAAAGNGTAAAAAATGSAPEDPLWWPTSFSTSIDFPTSDPSLSVLLIANNTFSLTQNRERALGVESVATALALRAADIGHILLHGNTASFSTDRSQPRLVFVSFITRNRLLSIAEGNSFSSTTRSGFWQTAVVQLQSCYYGGAVLVQDLEYDITAGSMKVAGFGSTVLEGFKSITVRRIRAKADVSATSDDAGVVIFGFLLHTPHIEVSQIKQDQKAGKNHVMVFFDDSMVQNVTEILFQYVECNFVGGLVANVFFSNSSFKEVDRVVMTNFTVTATQQEGTDLTAFVATLVMLGPRIFLFEHGTATLECNIGGLINAMSTGNANPHEQLLAQVIFSKVTLSLDTKQLASGLLISMGTAPKKGYGSDAITTSSKQLQPVQSMLLIDCTLTIKSAIALSSFIVMNNLEMEAVVLRGVTINGASTFFFVTPFLAGAKANLLGIDASALEEEQEEGSGGSGMNSTLGVKRTCSQFGFFHMYGRDKIYAVSQLAPASPFLAKAPPRLNWIRARHCGDTYSASRSLSGTFLHVPKPSRTPTWQNKTNTTTKSRTRSNTVSLIPPELNLETPAAANGVGTVAALSGLVGGAGAGVALDAARAVAIITLVARCRSYRETLIAQGLAPEEAKRKFHDKFLFSEPSFPQNVFQMCISPERGACIRGAAVSNLLVLAIVVLFSFLLGRKTLNGLRPSMSPVERQHASVWKYSRVPFFLGMAFAFLVGPWVTMSVVMLAVPGLPDGDGILAIISILVWLVGIIGPGLWIFYPRLSEFVATEAELQEALKKSELTEAMEDDEDDEDEDDYAADSISRSRRRQKRAQKLQLSEEGQRRAVGSVWRCEQSFVEFDLEDPNMVDMRFKAQQLRLKKKKLQEKLRRREAILQFKKLQKQNHGRSPSTPAGGKMTVSTLMNMPADEDDDDGEDGMYFGALSSGDDDDGADDVELQEGFLTPRRQQHQQQQRWSGSGRRGFSSDDDDEYDAAVVGDEAVAAYSRSNRFRGAAPTLQQQQQQRRATTPKRSSSSSKKKKEVASAVDPMAKLLLESEDVDDSVPLKPATKFHHFIWRATRWLQGFTGRIALLGHHVWLDDPAMWELRALKKKSGGEVRSGDFSLARNNAATAPSAGGAPGSFMWNCGTLLNKYIGSYTHDEPLAEKRTKAQKEKDKDLLCEKVAFGGSRVRRYHHHELRLRIAPYWAFVSLSFNFVACIIEGAALADPEACGGAMAAAAALLAVTFLMEVYVRPYLVPSRNAFVIASGFFLLGGAAIGAFATPVHLNPANRTVHEFGQVFFIISIVLMLMVGLTSAGLKFIFFFGKGNVLIRREMLAKLEKVLTRDRRLDVAPGGKFVISQRQQQQRSRRDENDEKEDVRRNQRNSHVSIIDTLWGQI